MSYEGTASGAITMRRETEPLLCGKCDRNMRASSGQSFIGFAAYFPTQEELPPDNSVIVSHGGEAFFEVYPELVGKNKWQICYVCWITSMGVKL